MPNIQSQYATGRLTAPISSGAELVALAYEITLTSAPAVNDTIEMGPLPGGHVPVDVIYPSDDLDANGTPTLALAFGVLNAGKTDLSTAAADGGAVWASGLTVGQTGGLARQTTKVIYDVQPVEAQRNLAYKVTAAAATFAAGKLRAIVICRATP